MDFISAHITSDQPFQTNSMQVEEKLCGSLQIITEGGKSQDLKQQVSVRIAAPSKQIQQIQVFRSHQLAQAIKNPQNTQDFQILTWIFSKLKNTAAFS